MADFLMKPKVDFAFKEIMTDELARIGFLSAILKLNPNDIKETRLLNTNLRKLHEKLKEDNNDILLWAKFLNAERKEEFDMLAEKNSYINHAYQQLQIISQDKDKRLEYEARQKTIWDHNQLMLEAEQRGIERGMERGMEQGIHAIILNSLEDNLSKEKILDKLQRYFSLTEEKAKNYYERFTRNDENN